MNDDPTPEPAQDACTVEGLGIRNVDRPPLQPLRTQQAQVPLSLTQRRLWRPDRLHRNNNANNNAFVISLKGTLDLVALKEALTDLVARHESLRTIIRDDNDRLSQVVLTDDAARVDFDVVETDEGNFRRVLSQARDRCFDVSREIPIEVTLFRLGKCRYVLLLLIHSIASDAFSIGPLVRDLCFAYANRSRGLAPSWPPLAVQYRDYSLWQHAALGDESDPESVIAKQVTYWQENLAGLPDQIELPIDRQRMLIAKCQSDRLRFRIEPMLHQSLINLAQDNQATLLMVLEAGLACLLYRLGAGVDIPLVISATERTDAALNSLVGAFSAGLVLRVNLTGDPSFREVLKRVRHAALAARAHQDLPFEHLMEVLSPERSTTYAPPFQVALGLQKRKELTFEGAGVIFAAQNIGTGAAKFDLAFNFIEACEPDGAAEGIEGTLDFASDMFDPTSAERFTRYLTRLLETVCAASTQSIQRIELLDAAERRMFLGSWNAKERHSPEATLPMLFEAQVRKSPESTAMVFEGETSTYSELNARSNRLAHVLIEAGIGPENVVALAVPRSPDLVVGVLGILKAGAAFLLLDKDDPKDRLVFLLEDSRAARLITTVQVAAGLPTIISALCLDAHETIAALSRAPNCNPADQPSIKPPSPLNPAYVIYTSGSTGKPKGVMISHDSICKKVLGNAKILGTNPNTCYAATAPMGFDPLVSQIVSPLMLGGKTLIISDNARADPAIFWQQVAQHNQGILGVTPTFLYQLLENTTPDQDKMRQLDTLTVGGEPLPMRLVALVKERKLARRLYNFYGQTETCIDATAWQMAQTIDGSAVTAPIGRPLTNYKVYVLDELLQPVPVGCKGEIYIAGAGLARGYVGRPGLTAERFVANPFGEPGSRMYRTGDLARWRTDGMLDFLGRADHQVKINGFRVETSEIERVLETHPGVAQAVVIVREDNPDKPTHRQLVAYVTTTEGRRIDPILLRQYLSKYLPNYMTPSAILWIDDLPMTSNGKLDRKALPKPDIIPFDKRQPRTPNEETLALMFAQVLGIQSVGIDDNFFDLGGHSLLATKLMNRIRAAFGIQTTIVTLLEAPTVANLAEKLWERGTV